MARETHHRRVVVELATPLGQRVLLEASTIVGLISDQVAQAFDLDG